MTDTHLCTTVHPGALPFLGDFLTSVAGQTVEDFDLWVALDAVDAETVTSAASALPSPVGDRSGGGASPLVGRLRFVAAGGTPADVRSALFGEVVRASAPDDLLVLADADDELEAARVEAARVAAATPAADGGACALRLIDAAGADLGARFAELPDDSPAALDELLPRGNVFGLSNTWYRPPALRAGLPVPSACVAVDWYLATAAWLTGARLALDRAPLVRYRQHGDNLAPVAPPFTAAVLGRATGLVRRHHELVENRSSGNNGVTAVRRAALRAARRTAGDFAAAIADPVVRDRYLDGLNRLPPPQAWWTMVAHPALEDLWRT